MLAVIRSFFGADGLAVERQRNSGRAERMSKVNGREFSRIWSRNSIIAAIGALAQLTACES